ncbi:MAG: hypothetical protein NTU83_10150 [Candidatus Hydrogenedentes bacterium]|nr:hypothetical protein [Candidatus Hydrogenedentota bacterium]
MIVAAEHACPVREDVLAAAAPEERESLEAEAGDKCLWWYQDSSFKVPYAITSDAIDYLAQQIEEERQSTSMLLLILSPVIGSQLNYQATIEFRNRFTSGTKQFDDVYLVHMVLSYDRGLTGFQKERTVVVRADGEVLAVFGDGVTGWLHV